MLPLARYVPGGIVSSSSSAAAGLLDFPDSASHCGRDELSAALTGSDSQMSATKSDAAGYRSSTTQPFSSASLSMSPSGAAGYSTDGSGSEDFGSMDSFDTDGLDAGLASSPPLPPYPDNRDLTELRTLIAISDQPDAEAPDFGHVDEDE